MKTYPYLFPLILIFLSITHCNCIKKQKQIPDGGPCSYDIKNYPAKILSIDEAGDDNADLTLEINPYGADKPDTLSYYVADQKGYVSLDELKKNNIKTGDTIVYQIMDIIDGACNPHIVSFVIEKYKAR